MLVNMKKEPEGKEKPEDTMGGDEELYPYGLSLHLDDDTLEKLGLKSLPVVGSTMTLQAKVRVTGTNADEKRDGDVEGSLRLQITDMELGAAKQGPNAGKLYEADGD